MAQETLRIGISESDSPPISVSMDQKLVGGVLKELGDLIENELNLKTEFVILSRKRIGLSIEKDDIHVICNTHENWIPDDELQWSSGFYPQVERVISLNDMPNIYQLSGLAGKRLSTIHGFHYPILEPFLQNGGDCCPAGPETNLAVMLRLVSKRLCEVAIVSEAEFSYWAKQNMEHAKLFKRHPLIISAVTTKCAVKRNSPITVSDLNKVIKKLKNNDNFKQIFGKYPLTAPSRKDN